MSRRSRLKLWIRQVCDGRGMSYKRALIDRADRLGVYDTRHLTDDQLDDLFTDIVAKRYEGGADVG